MKTNGWGAALRLAFRPVFGPGGTANDLAREQNIKADEAVASLKVAAHALKNVAEEGKKTVEAGCGDPLREAMRRISERL